MKKEKHFQLKKNNETIFGKVGGKVTRSNMF